MTLVSECEIYPILVLPPWVLDWNWGLGVYRPQILYQQFLLSTKAIGVEGTLPRSAKSLKVKLFLDLENVGVPRTFLRGFRVPKHPKKHWPSYCKYLVQTLAGSCRLANVVSLLSTLLMTGFVQRNTLTVAVVLELIWARINGFP